jgi:hypothetical protein
VESTCPVSRTWKEVHWTCLVVGILCQTTAEGEREARMTPQSRYPGDCNLRMYTDKGGPIHFGTLPQIGSAVPRRKIVPLKFSGDASHFQRLIRNAPFGIVCPSVLSLSGLQCQLDLSAFILLAVLIRQLLDTLAKRVSWPQGQDYRKPAGAASLTLETAVSFPLYRADSSL